MNADTKATAPVLDERFADFISHHVSINVASCAAQVPSQARALGCQVASDRRSVTLFVPAPHAASLLADLRAGGSIAAVFSRPATHETIQLKGAGATVAPLRIADRPRLQDFAAGFLEEIRQLGYRDPFASAMVSAVDGEMVAVTFTPVAAFAQTPGPGAGVRLGMKP